MSCSAFRGLPRDLRLGCQPEVGRCCVGSPGVGERSATRQALAWATLRMGEGEREGLAHEEQAEA